MNDTDGDPGSPMIGAFYGDASDVPLAGLLPGTLPRPSGRDLSATPGFVELAKLADEFRPDAKVRESLKRAVGTFEVSNRDLLRGSMTEGETVFEARLRENTAGNEIVAALHELRQSGAPLSDFFAYFDREGKSVGEYLRDRSSTPVSEGAYVYVLLSAIKYQVHGATAPLVQVDTQRVQQLFFCHVVAKAFTFKDGIVTLPAEAPSADREPLKSLIGLARAARADGGGRLEDAINSDVHGIVQGSGDLSDKVKANQMSLTRALTGVEHARAQTTAEVLQATGFAALLAVTVGGFHWLRGARPELFERLRVPMAGGVIVAAAVVFAVTGAAFVRPVEKFEDESEAFCTKSGACGDEVSAWASEAAKQSYIDVVDSTSDLAIALVEDRDRSLAGDLAAVSQRMHATDMEFREAVFTFRRVRQAKRFIVMTLAVALVLMVIVMLRLPAGIVVGAHVAAAVGVGVVAVFALKGNAHRFRSNWDMTYFPGPYST